MPKSEKSMDAAPSEASAPTPAPASPAKSGTSPWVIVAIVVVVLLALCCVCSLLFGSSFLAAIGNAASDAAKTSVSNNVYPSLGVYTTGTSSSGLGKLSLKFPLDAPVMSDASVVYSTDEGNTHSTGYNVDQSASAVNSYYESQLVANGWTITTQSSLFGYTLEATKDTRKITVVILGDETSSYVTVVVEPK